MAEQAPPPAEPAARPPGERASTGRLRKLSAWGVAVAGLLLAIALVAPTALSTGAGTRLIERAVAAATGGSLEIGALSLAWFDDQSADGISWADAESTSTLQLASLRTELSLWRALTGNLRLGKTTIDHLVELIAAEQGRVIKPDQFPDKGSFYRSDQFSFARIGVPAAYLDPGTDFVDRPPGWGREQVDHYTEVNYHQPSDEYDPSWNLDGMVTDARLGFWVGLAIANADDMPSWNPGDEFEAARLEALDAVSD